MHQHSIRVLGFICALCIVPSVTGGQDTAEGKRRYVVAKIWDAAPHNAFTDLVRWNDRFYCAFREGQKHVHGDDGRVRVIASDDGKSWESVALFQEKGVDLRDPKLSITPDDRLMVLMGGSLYRDRMLMGRLPRVAFFARDGAPPTKTIPVVIDKKVASENDWLWRVTWRDGVGYGDVYQAYYPPSAKKGPRTTDERPWAIHLVKTTDGVHYDLVHELNLPGSPGESAIAFPKDDQMMIIVRNGEKSNLGLSESPYDTWKWKSLDMPIGGPALIKLPNKKIVLATRAYDGGWGKDAYTCLGTLSLDGEFTEQVRLPSAGDTSYPGMVLHDGKLWVSYYSSHEGKTSIYLAQIPLTAFD